MSTFIDGNMDRDRALFLLTRQDIAYRGMADHWPKPRWCKFVSDADPIVVMVWMNRACSERFYSHCDPRRVIGHCDRAVWGDGCAARYAATDRQAVEQAGEILECMEPVEGRGEARVLKFAWRDEQQKGFFIYGECPD
jgi:hypothetical protein